MISIPIKEAVEIYPEIMKDLDGVLSDVASYEAPDPIALIDWSEDEKQRLYDFFKRAADTAKEKGLNFSDI